MVIINLQGVVGEADDGVMLAVVPYVYLMFKDLQGFWAAEGVTLVT